MPPRQLWAPPEDRATSVGPQGSTRGLTRATWPGRGSCFDRGRSGQRESVLGVERRAGIRRMNRVDGLSLGEDGVPTGYTAARSSGVFVKHSTGLRAATEEGIEARPTRCRDRDAARPDPDPLWQPHPRKHPYPRLHRGQEHHKRAPPGPGPRDRPAPRAYQRTTC